MFFFEKLTSVYRRLDVLQAIFLKGPRDCYENDDMSDFIPFAQNLNKRFQGVSILVLFTYRQF